MVKCAQLRSGRFASVPATHVPSGTNEEQYEKCLCNQSSHNTESKESTEAMRATGYCQSTPT